MAYNFELYTTASKETIDWLGREYGGIRTGRATPAVLDSVRVESYGSQMSLREIAAVGVEDARTIRINPWDASQVKAVEKALISADLGLSVVTDDKGIRVIFPELTVERRDQLTKLAKTKLEDARVAIRKARDESMKDIEIKEKEGGMGEDEKFKLKAELQKRVDESNRAIESAYEKKEAELKQ